jgi:hypothetical protein
VRFFVIILMARPRSESFETLPQRLKPWSFSGVCGMTKVMP